MAKKLCRGCGQYQSCGCNVLDEDFDILVPWGRERLRRMAHTFAKGGDTSRMLVDISREVCNLETDLTSQAAQITKLEADKAKLAEFIRPFIRIYLWESSEPDPFDIQDNAESLGLIKARPATEKDIELYAEYGIGVGDDIYEFTALLTETEDKKDGE